MFPSLPFHPFPTLHTESMNTRNRCARALNSVCAHAGQTNLVIAVVGLVLTIGGSYKAIQAHQRPATHDPDDKLCHILGSEQPSQVQVPSNGWNDNNTPP